MQNLHIPLYIITHIFGHLKNTPRKYINLIIVARHLIRDAPESARNRPWSFHL